MFTYFSANNARIFVDVLDVLVGQYNNTIHSSIKMTQKEVSRKENENEVWRNLYTELGGKTLAQKFSIRITKKKKTFHKGYTQRWTEEVFIIYKIQLIIPLTYEITYYNGEEIQGSFYEQELQKTKQEISRIEQNNKATS